MKNKFIFLYLLISFCSYSQEYSFFSIGEKELDGIEIYDLIQDNDDNYWLATSDGLIFHNGYKYKHIDLANTISSSIFNFKKDEQGTIYFHNLQNQIFRLKNEKVELFHTIQDNSISPSIFIETNKNNELFILSSILRRISHDSTRNDSINLADKKQNYISFLSSGNMLYCSTIDKVIQLNSENLKLTLEKQYLNSSISAWLKTDQKIYGINSNDMSIFELDEQSESLTYFKTILPDLKKLAIRLYYADHKIWLTGNFNGIYVFDKDFNPLFNGEKIYAEHFISDLYQDKENNILLSTFNDGILVISNTNSHRIAVPASQKITTLTSNHKNYLFIGTNNGTIIYHDVNTNQSSIIHSNPKSIKIDHLSYWVQNNRLLYSGFGGYGISSWDGSTLTNTLIHQNSLKNAHFYSKNNGVIASNIGISELNEVDNLIHSKNKYKTNVRAYCVAYDTITKTTYAGLSTGLTQFFESDSVQKLKYNGNSVHASVIVTLNGQVFIGTKKHGILIYENDKYINEIKINEPIKQLQSSENRLCILTNSNFYLYDLQKQEMTFSLSVTGIRGFEVINDFIYFANSEFITFSKIDELNSEDNEIEILFDNVLFNNTPTAEHSFQSGQNKIEFIFSVNTLKNRNKISYLYKLEGFNDTWHELDYIENSILFSGLNFGKYNFMVKAKVGKNTGSPISYQFEIQKPFYQSLWFYFAVFISALFLIITFFALRIKNLKRKANLKIEQEKSQKLILESELKALRSQMNPHFIFNSLNSIQELILNEDTDNSYDYIVMFAELVRNTLNYSSQEFIPLEKELEFLNVYLQLEKLRFKKDFIYTIDSNDITDISVPSMLIQPFIENALIHGLMHVSYRKKLSIKFELQEQLICIIEDNGIGRVKADEIKNRQSKQNESFALEAIKKRLSIFNSKSDNSVGYTIEDLYDGENPAGTRVILSMPYKKMY